MFYLARTPRLIDYVFSDLTWRRPGHDKVVYLTFDDGPIPEVTPWVLDQLQEAGAKATFFCVGENVQKHPDIYQRILDEGHAVGNHTHTHLSGWKHDTAAYLADVRACEAAIGSHTSQPRKKLFRPPYGKLTRDQKNALKQDYEIVMWDVLSADFDPRCSPERCVENIIDNAQQGSIVLMHDSLKAEKKIKIALPVCLQFFAQKGWRVAAL